MHGRLKVKTTAEQAEAKQKERDKKLKLYNAAMKLVFQKRRRGELDLEALQVSAGLLSQNSDIYTLWNFRREVLLQLGKESSAEVMQNLYAEELGFIETCLKANPKSYGCWHQRTWILNTSPTPDWKRELYLCNKFLEYDERNFHCWDYRRFVVKRAGVKLEDELEFTSGKIATNFSNYSSWHYRSKLLLQSRKHSRSDAARCHGDAATSGQNGCVLNEEALLKEFNIVQNAFFTDPDDQSAWFYQRWLLGKGETTLKIYRSAYCVSSRCLVVLLSLPCLISEHRHKLTVYVDDTLVDGEWSTPHDDRRYSPIWIFTHDPGAIPGRVKVRLTQDREDVSGCTIDMSPPSPDVVLSPAACNDAVFRMSLSAATNEILASELESCLQLHSLEPQNKWALLTVVLLMRTLDYEKYEPDITENLRKLEELDAQRCSYYRDLGSRFITESALSSIKDHTILRLSGKRLTTLYHPCHMAFFREIDLSDNRLTSVKDLRALMMVENLNLDKNELTNLDGLRSPRLKVLAVKNNHIAKVEDMAALSQCPMLTSVGLDDNPVCDIIDHRQQIRAMVASIVSID